MKVCYYNINILGATSQELANLCHYDRPDFICISEPMTYFLLFYFYLLEFF